MSKQSRQFSPTISKTRFWKHWLCYHWCTWLLKNQAGCSGCCTRERKSAVVVVNTDLLNRLGAATATCVPQTLLFSDWLWPHRTESPNFSCQCNVGSSQAENSSLDFIPKHTSLLPTPQKFLWQLKKKKQILSTHRQRMILQNVELILGYTRDSGAWHLDGASPQSPLWFRGKFNSHYSRW